MLTALLRPWPLCAVLARALVGYRAGGHRRRVQERLDDRLEFRTGDFGDVGHDSIVPTDPTENVDMIEYSPLRVFALCRSDLS